MDRFLRNLCLAGFVIAGVAACGPNDPLTLSSAQTPDPAAPGAVVFPIEGIQGEGGAALGRILSETLSREGTPAKSGTAGNGRNPLVVGRVEGAEARGSVMWVSIGWYAMAGDGSSLGDFRHEFVASAELWRKASPDVLQMIATEAMPKIVELVREPVGALVAEAEAERQRQVAEAEAEAKRKRDVAEAEAKAKQERERAEAEASRKRAVAEAEEANRKRDAVVVAATPETAPAPAVAEPAPTKFEPAIQAASQLEVLPSTPPGVKGVMPLPPQIAEDGTVAVVPVVPPPQPLEPRPLQFAPAVAALPAPGAAAPLDAAQPSAATASPLEVLAAAEAKPQLGIAPVSAQSEIRGHRSPEGIATKLLPPPAPVMFGGPVLLTPPPVAAELVPPAIDPIPPPLPAYAPPLPAPVEAVEPLQQAAVVALPPPVVAEPVPIPPVAAPSPSIPLTATPAPERARPGSTAGTGERLAVPLPLPETAAVPVAEKMVAAPPKPLDVAEVAPTPPPLPAATPVPQPAQPAPVVPQTVVDAIAGAIRPQAPAEPPVPTPSMAVPTPSPAAPSISVDPVVVELAFWQSIQTSRDPADFDEYLKKYPAGAFSGLARNRLAQAKAEQERIASQPVAPVAAAPSAPPATQVAEARTAAPTLPTTSPAAAAPAAPATGLWATPSPAASEPSPATSGGLFGTPAATPEKSEPTAAPRTAAARAAGAATAGRTPPAPAAPAAAAPAAPAPAPGPSPAVPVAPVVKETPSSLLPAREPAVAPLIPAAPPSQTARAQAPAAVAADPLPPKTPIHPVRPPVFLIKPVKGAPGDGNLALTRSLRDSLSAKDIAISDDPRQATYILEGAVKVDPPFAGRQKTKIIWMVTTIEGDQIGSAVQENAVRQGSLDGQWGQVAAIVSEAAVEGIQKLFPTAISRSNTNRSATINR